ncbi:hypothetical protein FOS14_01230 [Skermania sp. ID1734]|uniref:hypothetical protein n=1 Tax=Skermania sp. ID1734 TaxID=2597516 RepID=UPI00118052B4|nr:hypothetical protein [Skermania sp. ID1734]TSE02040.1 hypothetical protein FOS14_01230 [Skermania sp. ID1734]
MLSATARNRANTITVEATEAGLPVAVRIDRRELRYGAESLAAEVTRLCEHAAAAAAARKRVLLARAGVPADVLDRLGLPNEACSHDIAPATWMQRA